MPPLDGLLDRLPAPPDCLYLHDVALLPAARGHGAGRAFVALATRLARAGGLDWLTLVSVYGTGPVWQRCGFALRPLPGLAAQFGTAAAARYMAVEVGAKLRGTCELP